MSLEEKANVETEDDGDTYILTGDISIDSNVDSVFSGTLQGNGYKISGTATPYSQYIFAELTGKIVNTTFEKSKTLVKENNGMIKNCTVSDAEPSRGMQNEEIIGVLCKENYGVIKNCTVRGTIKSRSITGFIAGKNNGKIEGCMTSGYIFGEDSTGGICGVQEEDGVIKDCSSSATVESRTAAGGICGRQDEFAVFKDCSFSGDILNGKTSYTGIIVGLHNSEETILYKNCRSDNAQLNKDVSTLFSADLVECNFTVTASFVEKANLFSNGIDVKESDIDITLLDTVADFCYTKSYYEPVTFEDTELSIELLTDSDSDSDVLDAIGFDEEIISSDNFTLNAANREIVNENIQKVSTEEELYECNKVDTIKLEDDISISKDEVIFPVLLSDLNGNGHTIYNLNKPLINRITKTSTVFNVNFKNCFVTNDFERGSTGIIARNGNGNFHNITIENSTVDSNLSEIGGIIGVGSIGENNAKITECTIIDVTIRGKKNCGSIAGNIAEYDTVKVKNCNIIGEHNVGGVYGIGVGEPRSKQNASVINSTITGKADVGGIFGSDNIATSKNNVVKETQIIGSDTVGGIFGQFKGDSIKNSTVETTKITGKSITGGLGGETASEIIRCEAEVEINGETISGFIGESENSVIKNCTAFGTLNGDKVSGFISECKNTEIKNSYCENVLTGQTQASLFAINIEDSEIRAFTLSKSENSTSIVVNTVENTELDLYWSSLLNNSIDAQQTFGEPINSEKLKEFKTIAI